MLVEKIESVAWAEKYKWRLFHGAGAEKFE